MCKPSWIHPRRTDMTLHLHKHKPEDTPKVFLAPHVEGKFMCSSQARCELLAGSTCLLCKSSASWGSPACEIKHSENSYSESLHESSYQGKLNLRKSENLTLIHWKKSVWSIWDKNLYFSLWKTTDILASQWRLFLQHNLAFHTHSIFVPLSIKWQSLSSSKWFPLLQCICLCMFVCVCGIRFWTAGVSKLSRRGAWQARYPLHQSGIKVWVFKHYGRVKSRGQQH